MLYIDKVDGEKKRKITIDSLLNECWKSAGSLVYSKQIFFSNFYFLS